MHHFFKTQLPYCLHRQPDGSYLVLSRRYEPLEPPVSFAHLTKEAAQLLSHAGKPDLDKIYLYDDGCVPTRSDAHFWAYLARLVRLAHLARLKVSIVDPAAER